VGRRLIWTSVIGVPVAPGAKYEFVTAINYSGFPKMAYRPKELEELEKSGVKMVVLNNNYTSGDLDAARYVCGETDTLAVKGTIGSGQ
jgi:hypothetical protein